MATALYRSFNESGELLYVGISMRMAQRIKEHDKFSGWFEKTAKITLEWHASRSDAIIAEREAIKTERPIFNIQHNTEQSKHEKKSDDFDADEITSAVVSGVVFTRVKLNPIYSLKEVAEILQTSPQTVRGLISSGELGAIEWGSQVRKVRFHDEPREIISYRVSGWQLLEFLDSKGAR